MDYRLTNLKLFSYIPLLYIYELTDILFAIKSFKKHANSFDIFQYLQFNESTTIDLPMLSFVTRYSYSIAITANSYFCRLLTQIMECISYHTKIYLNLN